MLQLTSALILGGSRADQTKEQLQAAKPLADLVGQVAPVADTEKLGLAFALVG